MMDFVYMLEKVKLIMIVNHAKIEDAKSVTRLLINAQNASMVSILHQQEKETLLIVLDVHQIVNHAVKINKIK